MLIFNLKSSCHWLDEIYRWRCNRFRLYSLCTCVCISRGSQAKLWESIIWSNFPSAQNNIQSSQRVGGRITHKATCTNVWLSQCWEGRSKISVLMQHFLWKKQEVLWQRGRDPDDCYWLKRISTQCMWCKFTYRLRFNPVRLIGLLLQQIHDEALHRMVIWKRTSPGISLCMSSIIIICSQFQTLMLMVLTDSNTTYKVDSFVYSLKFPLIPSH